jgi:hypothetical protein
MSTLAKKALAITLLIVVPMIATNLVLFQFQRTEFEIESLILIGVGVILAGFITYFYWISLKIKKN